MNYTPAKPPKGKRLLTKTDKSFLHTKKLVDSKKLTGGQAAVLSLKKEKTKHVFGLIGSATMEMFDALYKEKTISFIGVRDERTGAHMADGYARAYPSAIWAPVLSSLTPIKLIVFSL